MGIFFAILALIGWGIGDFLIERSTRKIGDALAIFYISGIGTLLMFPFAYTAIVELDAASLVSLIVLAGAALCMLLATLLDFEALRVGKISVVEPIFALEIFVTAVLGAVLIRENLSFIQYAFVAVLVVGIFLVSLKSFRHLSQLTLERGVALAFGTAVVTGGVNFLMGLSSRLNDPLVTTWFVAVVILIVMAIYLGLQGRLREIPASWRGNKLLILGVAVFDNGAWVAFVYSALYIPIAIAIAISEAYIALAALLGLVFNRERLRQHQIVGLILTVIAAIVLSLVSKT